MVSEHVSHVGCKGEGRGAGLACSQGGGRSLLPLLGCGSAGHCRCAESLARRPLRAGPFARTSVGRASAPSLLDLQESFFFFDSPVDISVGY